MDISEVSDAVLDENIRKLSAFIKQRREDVPQDVIDQYNNMVRERVRSERSALSPELEQQVTVQDAQYLTPAVTQAYAVGKDVREQDARTAAGRVTRGSDTLPEFLTPEEQARRAINRIPGNANSNTNLQAQIDRINPGNVGEPGPAREGDTLPADSRGQGAYYRRRIGELIGNINQSNLSDSIRPGVSEFIDGVTTWLERPHGEQFLTDVIDGTIGIPDTLAPLLDKAVEVDRQVTDYVRQSTPGRAVLSTLETLDRSKDAWAGLIFGDDPVQQVPAKKGDAVNQGNVVEDDGQGHSMDGDLPVGKGQKAVVSGIKTKSSNPEVKYEPSTFDREGPGLAPEINPIDEPLPQPQYVPPTLQDPSLPQPNFAQPAPRDIEPGDDLVDRSFRPEQENFSLPSDEYTQRERESLTAIDASRRESQQMYHQVSLNRVKNMLALDGYQRRVNASKLIENAEAESRSGQLTQLASVLPESAAVPGGRGLQALQLAGDDLDISSVQPGINTAFANTKSTFGIQDGIDADAQNLFSRRIDLQDRLRNDLQSYIFRRLNPS